jgi:hypothetical protein
MVLENLKLQSRMIKYCDHHDGLMKQTWIYVISRFTYDISSLYFNLTLIHMYMDFEVLNFSEKNTCIVLCYVAFY